MHPLDTLVCHSELEIIVSVLRHPWDVALSPFTQISLDPPNPYPLHCTPTFLIRPI